MKVSIKTPTERIVTIEMTETEAETLRIVCANIGGSPEKSRRGNVDALENALKGIGIARPTDNDEPVPDGEIMFADRD